MKISTHPLLKAGLPHVEVIIGHEEGMEQQEGVAHSNTRLSPYLVVRVQLVPSERVDLGRSYVPSQGLRVLPLVVHPLLPVSGMSMLR